MSAPQRASTGKSVSATPSPASFPRVMEDTQKSRDLDRRHILEQELSGEQRLDLGAKDLAAQQGGVAATLNRLVSAKRKLAATSAIFKRRLKLSCLSCVRRR